MHARQIIFHLCVMTAPRARPHKIRKRTSAVNGSSKLNPGRVYYLHTNLFRKASGTTLKGSVCRLYSSPRYRVNETVLIQHTSFSSASLWKNSSHLLPVHPKGLQTTVIDINVCEELRWIRHGTLLCFSNCRVDLLPHFLFHVL